MSTSVNIYIRNKYIHQAVIFNELFSYNYIHSTFESSYNRNKHTPGGIFNELFPTPLPSVLSSSRDLPDPG